jgi:hypothetical protein
LGEEKDLHNAIKHQLKDIQLTSAPDPTSIMNLGHSYALRFERFGDVKDTGNAIKQLAEAVHLMAPDSPSFPMCLNNLRHIQVLI